MKHVLLFSILAFTLNGCFEFETVVRINTDGSGTVEQTVLMNKKMLRQLREIAESMEARTGTKGKGFDILDREKLFLEARTMGRDVRYASATRLFTRDKEGYTAFYRFDDINTLSINQNPKASASNRTQREEEPPPREPVTFSYFRGTPGTLIIRLPAEQKKERTWKERDREQSADLSDTSGLSLAMEMFKGFRMSMSVIVNGTIVSTTAANVDSNRVTLMAVDFEQVLRDRDRFAQLTRTNPSTVEEAKAILKQIPGIRMELAKETTVQFR